MRRSYKTRGRDITLNLKSLEDSDLNKEWVFTTYKDFEKPCYICGKTTSLEECEKAATYMYMFNTDWSHKEIFKENYEIACSPGCAAALKLEAEIK